MINKKRFVLLSIILAIVLVLGANFIIEEVQAARHSIARMFESDSEKIHRKIFLISDKEIERLVSEGMDLNYDSWKRIDSINELSLIQSTRKERTPLIALDTPRNEIPSTVYMNNRTMQRPYLSDFHTSFKDRPSYEIHFPVLNGKWLAFSMGISLSEEEVPPDLTVSLKQDGREVYTEKSSQTDQKKYLLYDEETKLFSDDRHIRFDADPKIVDYSKPAELYVSWDGTSDYAVYELDFKKFIK